MPIAFSDLSDDLDARAARIAAHARRADASIDRHAAAAIDDLLMPNEARLDDRLRSTVWGMIERATDEVVSLLLDSDCPPPGIVVDRMVDGGMLRDGPLLRHAIAEARQRRLAERLAGNRRRLGQSGLVARLSDCSDTAVAVAAQALVTEDARWRNVTGAEARLPEDARRELVWMIAAVLCECDPGQAAAIGSRAEALLAERSAVVPAVISLAQAIDARPDERGGLLADALADGRVSLFVAILSATLGLDLAVVRAALLDPCDERLWLLLRGCGANREEIARIGLLLADADPRRDLETLAESLDAIMRVDDAETQALLEHLRLPSEMRAACDRLSAAGLERRG